VPQSIDNEFRWLANGQQAFTRAMLAIDQATRSLDMEIYIFAPDASGRAFLEHMIRAASRG